MRGLAIKVNAFAVLLNQAWDGHLVQRGRDATKTLANKEVRINGLYVKS